MPTWLIVLLCLPPILWFAYCALRFALGFSLCPHCIFGWTMGLVALGLWMLLSGLSEGAERRAILGATIAITFVVIGGIVFLLSRLGARRKRYDKDNAVNDLAVVAGVGAVAAGAAVGKAPEGPPDGAPDGAAEADLDLDLGLDI